jgi:hypothetical protein
MDSLRDYYFVRVNGKTVHNNPNKPDCYARDEPPAYPQTAYNHVDYCLRLDLVRMGWPGVGDLRNLPEVPESNDCYGELNERVREHLRQFRNIPLGSGVLMPDKRHPGLLYAGEVTLPYGYFHEPPEHPFECAHRVGVRWDRDPGSSFLIEYQADDFGMSAKGGWWLWPFRRLDVEHHADLVRRIEEYRTRRQDPNYIPPLPPPPPPPLPPLPGTGGEI